MGDLWSSGHRYDNIESILEQYLINFMISPIPFNNGVSSILRQFDESFILDIIKLLIRHIDEFIIS